MKAAGGKNLSLIDAVLADITDSSRLEAKWRNRARGERSVGEGPDGSTLLARDERRQIERAEHFLADYPTFQAREDTAMESSEDANFMIFDAKRSHRPDVQQKRQSVSNLPSVKAKRRRSLETTYFKKILGRFHKVEKKTKVLSM